MNDRIYNIVESLKRKYNTSDPYELAEECGIFVKRMDIGNCLGFYTEISRVRYIVLNPDLNEMIYPLVLSHELGHGVMHRDLAEMKKIAPFSFFDIKSKPEYEANMFAADLLISDTEILDYAKDGYTYEQVAGMLNVMKEIVILKMIDMNNRGYNFNIPYIPKAKFFE